MKSERARLAASATSSSSGCRANAPSAQITSEFDIAINAVGVQLNGTSLATSARRRWFAFAELEGIFHPLRTRTPISALVHANEAWATAGGAANAGAA